MSQPVLTRQLLKKTEVELESLGRLFIKLVDAPPSQDNTETSRDENVEVISISSNTEKLSRREREETLEKYHFRIQMLTWTIFYFEENSTSQYIQKEDPEQPWGTNRWLI